MPAHKIIATTVRKSSNGMKKAKILMTAIVLLSIVSGALAFKAKQKTKLGVMTVYTCDTINNLCDITVMTDVIITGPNAPAGVTFTRHTFDPTVTCSNSTRACSNATFIVQGEF